MFEDYMSRNLLDPTINFRAQPTHYRDITSYTLQSLLTYMRVTRSLLLSQTSDEQIFSNLSLQDSENSIKTILLILNKEEAIDFEESFAPIARLEAVRCSYAFAAP
ncbi:hypothetical protein Tco_0989665 [Tanacetum coccineum]|uniref:Uncharacterized protein n=1 Tax=Tanacetum coccineum TaxID=301880 RepID=A0ABQ5EUA9_9ASTR